MQTSSRIRFSIAALALLLSALSASGQRAKPWSIAIHAGAGSIERATTSAEDEARIRATLRRALEAGSQLLSKGASSLDAVEAAIRIMELESSFDAGRGSIFNSAGQCELDAAIMDGATLRAGSVAAVTRSPHPITLARAVMEKSPHVLIVGAGADAFLRQTGSEEVEPAYFFEEGKWQSLIEQLKREGRPAPARPAWAPASPKRLGEVEPLRLPAPLHYGTVGVVALDRQGNLAAGTSTGGMQGKLPGRVGDSPIIGAGTYASNRSCAVSATGVGEFFIRLTAARELCRLVETRTMSLQDSANTLIHKEVAGLKGVGGVIAMTPDGEAVWSFNTPGMFRGRMREGGQAEIAIFGDEP